ncbi:hypothetical protein D8B26_004155 [Coccidioides posadasii str. Silveira]|uniref:Short chain dehydrogenase/reductase n=2 Tax=Coccidioides posadasii TaxID=199306 RepID=E9DJ51_COCPS|nr:short chain dehydrogenase/reductase [Coccidioides posadasii str. Silveira]KMM69400.1 short chain dehydrogenase/reductase [Coccidioides posadasii RMSCC 3488]QVM09495.1 hypothetical protein D8B26_004155 [Coccidioides posadasii str. Silveira]
MAATVFRPGATALITGGGSGIGFAVAQLCRSHDMNLILVDIHADNLAKVHTLLGNTENAKTITHVMDVSDVSSWEYLRDKLVNHFPAGIDLLMLNAGATFKPEDSKNPWGDIEYFQKTFATNFTGVLNGIYTFLPMISEAAAQGPKAIVITGSKQGITNPPGANNPAYNASKSALKSIAEFLAHDMHSNSATKNVHVHLLIPGWTFTGLTGSEGPIHDDQALALKPKGAWIPSQVARYMYEKMNQGKFYIVCPDEDVSEALDKARMEWAIGDIIEGRPALSRWHEEWKDKASEWINEEAAKR